jgi:hypothetical protein
MGPASINSIGESSLPEPSIGSSAALVTTVPGVASPSNPPEAIVTHAGTLADPSNGTPAGTDLPNSKPPDETAPASLNHDYNFFDELDARLAGIEDHADPSGD